MIGKLIEAVEAGTATDFRAILSDTHTPAERAILCGKAARAYRGSLDAAKALHDALLPGWEWGRTEGNIFVKNPAKNRNHIYWGGPNEIDARSFLLAILRALEAEGR